MKEKLGRKEKGFLSFAAHRKGSTLRMPFTLGTLLTRLSAQLSGTQFAPTTYSPTTYSPTTYSPTTYSPSIDPASYLRPGAFENPAALAGASKNQPDRRRALSNFASQQNRLHRSAFPNYCTVLRAPTALQGAAMVARKKKEKEKTTDVTARWICCPHRACCFTYCRPTRAHQAKRGQSKTLWKGSSPIQGLFRLVHATAHCTLCVARDRTMAVLVSS